MQREVVVVQRDCPARLVPAGTPIMIPKDTFVNITQALGGNYTVAVNGNLARIDGTDADAIGKTTQAFNFAPSNKKQLEEEHIWQALKTIFDPEIPVNIVDLGLIYDVSVEKNTVLIAMTLTAPGCGMGPVLISDIEYRVGKVPYVEDVKVDLVFDPPWSREMMSDEAKLETGLFF